MHILIIEDDKELALAIKVLLENENFKTTICHNGNDGEYYIKQNIFDLVIMDRMIPEIDGLTLTTSIRQKNITVPILMLTAMGQIDDRVDGLNAGADDYLVKPFDTRELLARIRAAMRRPSLANVDDNIHFSDISLDLTEHLLIGKSAQRKLSKKETELFKLFFQNSKTTLQRTFLFAKVWGMESEVEDSVLDTYIFHLRRHLKLITNRVYITTIRGVGYKMEEIS